MTAFPLIIVIAFTGHPRTQSPQPTHLAVKIVDFFTVCAESNSTNANENKTVPIKNFFFNTTPVCLLYKLLDGLFFCRF
jgi:hypothetical protein